jgi:hypothetical protein
MGVMVYEHGCNAAGCVAKGTMYNQPFGLQRLWLCHNSSGQEDRLSLRTVVPDFFLIFVYQVMHIVTTYVPPWFGCWWLLCLFEGLLLTSMLDCCQQKTGSSRLNALLKHGISNAEAAI